MIPHNRPTIGEEEIEAVKEVLKSGWVAQGKRVKEFEDLFCWYLGWESEFAAAFSSGTAALYVTLVTLGITSGAEVIIPTYVCPAVLNAIYLARANPVLVDIDPYCFNISFEETKEKINSKTKAIIVPHIFGVPADVDKFVELGIPIVEDCAQAIGAKLNGKHLGTFGEVAIFSFYASKVLTTGYGGMIFSKDKNFIEKVKDYREFDCRQEYKPRFNFQMSDFQAAMGKIQLKRLPYFLEKRRKIANEYYKILPLEKVWPLRSFSSKKPNFYRFLVRTKKPNDMKLFMKEKGIKAIIPMETYELLHRYLNQDPHNFPVSDDIAKTTLSLPIYPSLTDSEIQKIKNTLREYFIKKEKTK